jgi:hypothetical protein
MVRPQSPVPGFLVRMAPFGREPTVAEEDVAMSEAEAQPTAHDEPSRAKANTRAR